MSRHSRSRSPGRVEEAPARNEDVGFASQLAHVLQRFANEVVLRSSEKTCQILAGADGEKTFSLVPDTPLETQFLLTDGSVLEKASVHVGTFTGSLSQESAEVMSLEKKIKCGSTFSVSSLSVAVHPRSPLAPSMGFNCRIFITGDVWWVGGCSDLTPSYIDEEDCRAFHQGLKAACDAVNKAWYNLFKEAADKYYWLPHRGEHKGVGGIMFDDMREDFDTIVSFANGYIDATLHAYARILERQAHRDFNSREKAWQLLRRGRIVEFNFMLDRGTKWGLNMSPPLDAENVLLPTPPDARFAYREMPVADSPEARALDVFKRPRAWAVMPLPSILPDDNSAEHNQSDEVPTGPYVA